MIHFDGVFFLPESRPSSSTCGLQHGPTLTSTRKHSLKTKSGSPLKHAGNMLGGSSEAVTLATTGTFAGPLVLLAGGNGCAPVSDMTGVGKGAVKMFAS